MHFFKYFSNVWLKNYIWGGLHGQDFFSGKTINAK